MTKTNQCTVYTVKDIPSRFAKITAATTFTAQSSIVRSHVKWNDRNSDAAFTVFRSKGGFRFEPALVAFLPLVEGSSAGMSRFRQRLPCHRWLKEEE